MNLYVPTNNHWARFIICIWILMYLEQTTVQGSPDVHKDLCTCNYLMNKALCMYMKVYLPITINSVQYRTVLHSTVLFWNLLYYARLYCPVLYCTGLYQYPTTIPYCPTLCCTLLYQPTTILYCAVPVADHCATSCNSVSFVQC